MRNISGIALICLLTACTTTLPLYDHSGRELQAGNGWLALLTDAPRHNVELEFDSGAKSFIAPILPPGRSFALVQIPVGEYIVGGLSLNGRNYNWKRQDFENETRFVVRPGMINYFGEIRVTSEEAEFYNDKVNVEFNGDVIQLEKALKAYYPELADMSTNMTVISDATEE